MLITTQVGCVGCVSDSFMTETPESDTPRYLNHSHLEVQAADMIRRLPGLLGAARGVNLPVVLIYMTHVASVCLYSQRMDTGEGRSGDHGRPSSEDSDDDVRHMIYKVHSEPEPVPIVQHDAGSIV